jgi:hypothetical protein
MRRIAGKPLIGAAWLTGEPLIGMRLIAREALVGVPGRARQTLVGPFAAGLTEPGIDGLALGLALILAPIAPILAPIFAFSVIHCLSPLSACAQRPN